MPIAGFRVRGESPVFSDASARLAFFGGRAAKAIAGHFATKPASVISDLLS